MKHAVLNVALIYHLPTTLKERISDEGYFIIVNLVKEYRFCGKTYGRVL